MCYSACTFDFESFETYDWILDGMVTNFLALLVSTLPTHSISKWFETYDRMPTHFLSLRYFLLCLHMSISKAPKRMTNTHKDLVAWLMHNPPICFAFLVFWGWLLSAGGPFWDPVWAHGCLFEVSWGPYAHFTSFQGPFCEAKGPSRLHTERNWAHLGVPWRPKWNSWGHQADIAKTYKNMLFLMVFEGWRLTVDLHFWSLSSLHVSFEVPGGYLYRCRDSG